MTKKGQGLAQKLLSDPDVKRWYDNVSRGSKGTADNWLRILRRFTETIQRTPRAFVSLSSKARDDAVSDYVGDLLARRKAGSYVHVVKKAIVSWLEWNGKRLTRKIKVPDISLHPTLEDAHIPTQDELRRVLGAADGRACTAIAFMAFAGVRPEVLGDYEGNDGLRIRNLPEAAVTPEGLTFQKVPTLVKVPGQLSKTGRSYFTFLGHEGCDLLAAHIRDRMRRGEVITLESSIIKPLRVPKPFMHSLNVSDLVRKPMRAAGLKEPPYIWRSYFSSRSMMAEARGLLRDYRQFFMGHSGDIEHVYALHKRLPPDTIEAMRKGYQAALPDLETRATNRPDDGTERAMRLVLQVAGVPAHELEGMELGTKSIEELTELLRHVPGRQDPVPVQRHQQVVPMSRLQEFLNHGWTFKSSVPGDQAILEAPVAQASGPRPMPAGASSPRASDRSPVSPSLPGAGRSLAPIAGLPARGALPAANAGLPVSTAENPMMPPRHPGVQAAG